MANGMDVRDLFRDLKPRSMHSLKTAMEATRSEGLTGTLIMQIPSGTDKPNELYFMNAEVSLIPAVKLAG